MIGGDTRKASGTGVATAMLVAVAIVVCTLSLYIDWYCDALNY